MSKPDAAYEMSEKWQDVVPIPQNEGGPNPLAAIAYTDEYAQATSYLRAVMANNEMSERVLDLTEHIISLNPAHYTVWLYRAATLKHLSSDLNTELKWLNGISVRHLKNYQIWHHRQTVMSWLHELPDEEFPFLAHILARDVKNYHVWSYRQWLVQRFNLWPSPSNSFTGSELDFTRSLIDNDVRNNSAWNHRFFVVFGNSRKNERGNDFDPQSVPNDAWEREIEFVKDKIVRAPQNGASWNYLSGILRRMRREVNIAKEFAGQFADLERIDEVRSSFALDFLVEVWESENDIVKAKKALSLLAERFDPIRKNYWNWRADRLIESSKAGDLSA